MHSITVNHQTVFPSKIVCIGRNYVAHIEELGNEIPDNMVVFNKPNSAIGNVLHAQLGGQTLHYESELAFVVRAGHLSAVGFGLDLTKRELQGQLKNKGLPWERAKAFDGAALFSAFVELPADISGLALRMDIDGQQRQYGSVALMMYPPQTILEELATFTTLEDGDVIMTGTPSGVGEVRSGEQINGQVLSAGKIITGASWLAQ